MNEDSSIQDRRLWIGNLDVRLTEYQLLKILQKCGKIVKFDMLFHKGGPQVGQPRGYAFVTFTTIEESVKAMKKLSGTLIGSKNVVVRLAKNINYDDLEKPKPKIEIPVLAAGGSKSDGKISKQAAIQAIESKLKFLEKHKDDFEINQPNKDTVPLIQKFQFNKSNESSQSKPSSSNNYKNQYKKHRTFKPYNKRY